MPTSSTANRLRERRRGKDKHYFIQALIFLTRVVAMRYKWTRLYLSEELQTSYSCKSPVPNRQVALRFPGLAWKNSTAPLFRASWISHYFQTAAGLAMLWPEVSSSEILEYPQCLIRAGYVSKRGTGGSHKGSCLYPMLSGSVMTLPLPRFLSN